MFHIVIKSKSVSKRRLIYPHGYFYNEPNCEPHWTDEPVKPITAFYENVTLILHELG